MPRPRPDASVAAWLKRQAKETLFVSVVTMGELRRGITLLAERSSRRAELERGERQLAGRPLNVADGMIAATALEYRLTLVTRNVKDFAGIGLVLLNPWDTT
jgi:predicted nucleic acid-binding protein